MLEFLVYVITIKHLSLFPLLVKAISLILQKDLDYLSANGFIDYQDELYTCFAE